MYMKVKCLLLSVISVLCLSGCKKDFKVETDFTFDDKSVQIKDTLRRVRNETAHIVFLYGQSNADGVSYNEYLKTNDLDKFNEYAVGYENVYINFFSDGGLSTSNFEFRKATLGCGCIYYTYGPEMGIAEIMSKAYPEEQTFIIKWTWGGTALHNQWLDGNRNRGDLYNPAMDFSIKCLNYLGSKGYTLSIEGICWMQGESDAFKLDWSDYYNDTYAYVSYLRHDLKSVSESIKFVDAGINEEEGVWPHPGPVNRAKREFAALSDLNIYIDTNAMGLTTKNEPVETPDIAHYDSLSMVKLGQAFGEALRGE